MYRAIRRYFSEDAETIQGGTVHPLYLFVRRWSPAFVPALVGGLTLALALILASVGATQIDRTTVAGIPLLFLVYLTGGGVFAYALYFAGDETAWLATTIYGSGLFVAALMGAVAGLLVGLAIVAASAALVLLYARSHAWKIAPATVAITLLVGRYFRTLPPGLNLRLPGERVVATIETWERRFTSPTQTVEIRADDGRLYRAAAAATISYRIEPELAHRTLQELDTWERDLHATTGAVLRESLTRWAMLMVAGENVPQGALARATLTELRMRAQLWGGHVANVRVRNIQLDPADGGAQDGWQPAYGATPEMVTPVTHNTPTLPSQPIPVAQAAVAVPVSEYRPQSPSPRAASPQPQPPISDPGWHPRSDPAMSPPPAPETPEPTPAAPEGAEKDEQPLPPALSPATLADAYQAVRERRITDPTTIRQVARAFARVSEDLDTSDQFPYNAAAAARILAEYAEQLEQREARRRSRSPVHA
jgi:hypothetical protein